MRKHIMAITYKPKIPAFMFGVCRQTIRSGDKIQEGDQILFHGWSGLPYRSKWTWRKRITVSRVINVDINFDIGFHICEDDNIIYDWCRWDNPAIDELAALDFIDPPTGIELWTVLTKLNKAKEGNKYQIIRW